MLQHLLLGACAELQSQLVFPASIARSEPGLHSLQTCLVSLCNVSCCTFCMRCLVQVRGPVVVGQYHGVDTPTTDAQGWFDTGDVASLDTLGYMRITDRSKDVIKSGGEWISSITLENLAMGHPQVGGRGRQGAAMGYCSQSRRVPCPVY